MTDTSSGLVRPPSRSQIREEALDWFARAQLGPLEDESQAQFDAWLAQSVSHQAAYWRLEGAWEEAGRLAALRPAKRGGRSAFSEAIRTPAKISVVIALAVVIGAIATQFSARKVGWTAYTTDVGGRKVLTLADGSQIELNTNTKVRVAVLDGSRTVWLDKGEAYFQIVHDAARPFSVIAGNRRVIDLGTKFAAREESGKLEVSLFEGRARVEVAGSGGRTAELMPGDTAVASTTAITVVRKPVATLDDQLGWRRGVLVFKGMTLADAVTEMNRYNTEKLVVIDTNVAQQTIDGTFPIHAVGQFAEMAQAVFGLRAEKRGTETIITR